MKKTLLFPFLLMPAFLCAQKEIPAELSAFVLPGYSVLDYEVGDLNADSHRDAIVILKSNDEDSLAEDQSPRPFLLLLRGTDGKLRQHLRADSVVMCRHCGGVMGDPYADLDISDNGFTLYFYGGSSWRWSYEYRFDYHPQKKDWHLVKEISGSFHAGDAENTMEEMVVTEEELGYLPVSYFQAGGFFETQSWEVTAARSFFYDQPRVNTRPRKTYVVKGDRVSVVREFTNFVRASYENKRGELTTGFLLKKELRKLNTSH